MRMTLTILVIALALTSCGRKGALQPPPGATAIEEIEEGAPRPRGLF